jgi:hypothetical protein
MYESKIVRNKISYAEMMRNKSLTEYQDGESYLGFDRDVDSNNIHAHSRHEIDGTDINSNEVETMNEKEWKQRVIKKAHDFKQEPEIVGTLISVKENDFINKETGQHGRDFVIRKESGEEVLVYGKDVIVTLLKEVALNTAVKIKYLGLEKSKKSGRAYENFEVFTRE